MKNYLFVLILFIIFSGCNVHYTFINRLDGNLLVYPEYEDEFSVNPGMTRKLETSHTNQSFEFRAQVDKPYTYKKPDSYTYEFYFTEKEEDKHISLGGNLLIELPEGWSKSNELLHGHKMVFYGENRSDGSNGPIISFEERLYKGTFQDFVEIDIQLFNIMAGRSASIDIFDFETDDGLKGKKVIFPYFADQHTIKYYLPINSQTALAIQYDIGQSDTSINSIVNNTIKTIRFDNTQEYIMQNFDIIQFINNSYFSSPIIPNKKSSIYDYSIASIKQNGSLCFVLMKELGGNSDNTDWRTMCVLAKSNNRNVLYIYKVNSINFQSSIWAMFSNGETIQFNSMGIPNNVELWKDMTFGLMGIE
jgi:hypothetical protein